MLFDRDKEVDRGVGKGWEIVLQSMFHTYKWPNISVLDYIIQMVFWFNRYSNQNCVTQLRGGKKNHPANLGAFNNNPLFEKNYFRK